MPIYVYQRNKQISTNAIRNNKVVKAIYAKEQGQDAVCVWGDDVAYSLFTYTIQNNAVTITGLNPNYQFSGNLLIPDVIKGKQVTRIGERALSGCTGLTTVTIPNSVIIIDNYAFSGCTGLTSITIPDSVTSIGSQVFSGCTGLASIMGSATNTNLVATQANPSSFIVNITSGTSIGNSAFRGCKGLKSVTIPDSVTSIGQEAFYNCTGLTSVTIPDSVPNIGYNAFKGCTGLTKITGSSTVASHIASTCNSQSFEVVITSGTSIRASAFSGCTGLTSITIPDSVTSIGQDAFEGTTWYNNQPDGLVYAGKVAYKYKGTLQSNSLIILEEGTLGISGKAFYNCTGLVGIGISDSVTNIGNSAFYNCSNLTVIDIPNSVTSIDIYAFSGCTGLTSIIIGKGVTNIGDNAFEGCTGLTSVTIPASVTSIGTSAFNNCYRLIEVYNKSSLKITAGSSSNGKVAYYAKNVYTNEGGSKLMEDEGGYVIYTDGDEKLLVAYHGLNIKLSIPWYITKIHQYAFRDCTAFTSVTIDGGVTSIGNYAFYGCTGLTSATMVNSVTSVGQGAFKDCRSLTSVTIGNSVTSIGSETFYSCTGLTSITFNGTKAQWNTITKGSSWNFSTGKYTIHCTDGDIPKQ